MLADERQGAGKVRVLDLVGVAQRKKRIQIFQRERHLEWSEPVMEDPFHLRDVAEGICRLHQFRHVDGADLAIFQDDTELLPRAVDLKMVELKRTILRNRI